jgi:hypothetical protein
MSQPNKQPWAKLPYQGLRAADIDKLLDALRVLDRTVLGISMEIHKVPRRDRAAMLEQHRILHDVVRSALPRLLYQTEKYLLL